MTDRRTDQQTDQPPDRLRFKAPSRSLKKHNKKIKIRTQLLTDFIALLNNAPTPTVITGKHNENGSLPSYVESSI